VSGETLDNIVGQRTPILADDDQVREALKLEASQVAGGVAAGLACVQGGALLDSKNTDTMPRPGDERRGSRNLTSG